ncbi:MAG: MBL fold metallo-hydrolase [Planctomycetes bacterium]|nr:MBL fold metallo-hydrolase [Planctomycetota bacterium]
MLETNAEFEHAGIRMLGFSLAGEEAYIALPELNVAFDVGRAPRSLVAIDHVFLSHGHMDHAAGIAYYFAQRMFVDNSPGNIYVPQPLVEPIQRLLRVWADIDGHEAPAHVHAALPDSDVVLRRDLLVRPFAVNHPCRRHDRSWVQSLGFSAIEVRHKLKDEYQGLVGPQLVELKKQGIDITRRLEIPLVTYCGDTAPGSFLDLDYVRNSKILLLECTFVEAGHRDRARAGNHMHIDDLRDIVPRLNNERILLTHLSRRTGLSEAKHLLDRLLPGETDERIRFLMSCRRRRRHAALPKSSDS